VATDVASSVAEGLVLSEGESRSWFVRLFVLDCVAGELAKVGLKRLAGVTVKHAAEHQAVLGKLGGPAPLYRREPLEGPGERARLDGGDGKATGDESDDEVIQIGVVDYAAAAGSSFGSSVVSSSATKGSSTSLTF
jgi:hypothetical protein